MVVALTGWALIQGCQRNGDPAHAALLPPTDLTQWVNPMIGTAQMGHTYPGATRPYGMVQVTPQTRYEPLLQEDGSYNGETYRYCAGYQHADTTVLGFAHTSFSGTGHSDLGDLLLMPTVDAPDLTRDEQGAPRFGSAFQKENEHAEPGFYRTHFDRYDIAAEVTATDRVGLHQYTYESGGHAHMVLDLTYNIYHHPDKNVWTFVRVENDSTVVGYRQTTGWGRTRLVHFALRFDRPMLDFGYERGQELAYNGFYRRFDETHGFPEMAGRDLQAWFDFGTLDAGEALGIRVALSGVSTAGALANLEEETPSMQFDRLREDADAAWEQALSLVNIEPLRTEDATTFYTALYHSMLSPVLYEDVDGQYRGLDQNIHTSEGFTNYTVFSLWDTYRALHPWMNLTQPERASDMVQSMLAHAEQSVHGMLPIWSHQANENWCMIGYHAVSVLADAVATGVPGIDVNEALHAAVQTAQVPYFDGLGEYMEYGYVPDDLSHSSVSKTLEYAYDDWCIARLAEAAGKADVMAEFDRRAGSYGAVWDASSGFMRPRLADGTFRKEFDPLDTHGQGFIEGNAWNYGLYVPHANDSLIAWHGGPEAFIAHLDSLFTMELDDRYFAHTEDISRDGIIGNYVHGNEPGHHIAYLYNAAGAPEKTQERVRMICDRMYGPDVNGLCGNDDAGQMSAWYLFSALGFYPVAPGSGWYELGSPAVSRATVQLGAGRALSIETVGNAPGRFAVESVHWNGERIEGTRIHARELTQGGTLKFVFQTEAVDAELKGQTWQGSPPHACALNINLKGSKSEGWEISSHLNFNKGSWVVSPNDTHNMLGRFQLSIEANPFIQLAETTTEWPAPSNIEEPFGNPDISVAQLPTLYRQSFEVRSQADFQVQGHATFVLEPSCIFYRMDFELTQVQGVLELQTHALHRASPPNTI